VDDDDAFDVEYAAFDAPGTYRILVVTPGRDGAFGFADGGSAAAIRTRLTDAKTAAETVTILRDAYGGAGVDDRIVGLNVTATAPRVAVETVSRAGDDLVVTGTSNRENGTLVLLDLRDGTRPVAAADAEVNASGRWRTTVDVSGVDPGRYALRAETGDALDDRTVRIGDAPTPATATRTPRPTETSTATPTPPTPESTAGVAAETGETVTGATRTAATGVGFGAVSALLALLSALLIAVGRRP
jgi:hypothetical protein